MIASLYGSGLDAFLHRYNGKVQADNDVHTISTPSVHEGFVYTEYAGIIHCSLYRKGLLTHDSFSRIGVDLVLTKVLLGKDGDLLIIDHGKEKPKVKTVNMGAPVYSSPVVANKTLYVATQTHLYAIGK